MKIVNQDQKVKHMTLDFIGCMQMNYFLHMTRCNGNVNADEMRKCNAIKVG